MQKVGTSQQVCPWNLGLISIGPPIFFGRACRQLFITAALRLTDRLSKKHAATLPRQNLKQMNFTLALENLV